MVKNKYFNLSGWGRNIKASCQLINYDEKKFSENFPKSKLIPRGLGRAYGDSALQPKLTVSMTKHNKIIKFDRSKGIIKVQSGVSISQLLSLIVQHGWFMPVTPGSKNVTIGGMVASNVHGKNHHVDGGFGNFVENLSVIDVFGNQKQCSKKSNRDLFYMTLGGMGLTGIITEITFKLLKIETSKIIQKKIFTKDLRDTMNLFENEQTKYSVAWIDFNAKNTSIGRSIIYLGDHAKKKDLKKANVDFALRFQDKLKLNIKFESPFLFINYYTIKIFNYFYNLSEKIFENKFTDLNNFFYPLDKIKNWNLLYGKKGFVQYQFVLPKEKSYEGILEVIKYLNMKKTIPFLPVLKYFNSSDVGILSFPIRGFTLAMDFPHSKKLIPILNHLDKIIIKYHGKIYLTKDSRISKSNFKKMHKEELLKFKKSKYFDITKFSSLQSERLFK